MELTRIVKLSSLKSTGGARLAEDMRRVEAHVRKIIEDVRVRGDEAVVEYTERFDGVKLSPETIEVPRDRVREALSEVPARYIEALRRAYELLLEFHRIQKPKPLKLKVKPGLTLEDLWIPLRRIGIYAPGGLKRYPSSILMAAAPAKAAGVKEIVACTPPKPEGLDPLVLAALHVAGVERVFQVGGVQALAAMAFGTETLPRVDKIVGPGNIYVAAAKTLLYGYVGVDLPAGPSEVLILSDGSVKAEYTVLDLLAQLEHGPGSKAILISLSKDYALEVAKLAEKYAFKFDLDSSVLEGLTVAVAEDIGEALAFIEEYAPEHVEVHLREASDEIIERLWSCGTVLLGEYGSAALSDYATGANHILPTGGVGRFASSLSVYDFMKRITVQRIDGRGFQEIAGIALTLAEAEGFKIHREAVESRLRGKRS